MLVDEKIACRVFLCPAITSKNIFIFQILDYPYRIESSPPDRLMNYRTESIPALKFSVHFQCTWCKKQTTFNNNQQQGNVK